MGRWEGGELKIHRWSSLVQVLKALLQREEALKHGWNKDLFGDIGTTSIIDSALTSEMFWKYCHFLVHVAGAVDVGSSYCEGCSCHEHDRLKHNAFQVRKNEIAKRLLSAIGSDDGNTLPYPGSCVLKGRRSAELASGAFSQFIKDVMTVTKEVLVEFRGSLQDSEWTTILGDWMSARDTYPSLVCFFVGHWPILPMTNR